MKPGGLGGVILAGLLSAPVLFLALVGARFQLWPVAGALAACALVWPLRGRLHSRARWLLFPLSGWIGGVAGELLRPRRLRFSVPDAAERLAWIAEVTHPEALLLGGIYVGLGVALVVPLFPRRSKVPPPRSSSWVLSLGTLFVLGAGVWGQGEGFSLLILDSKNIFDREVRRAAIDLPRLQAQHRARTGGFAPTLAELGMTYAEPLLEVEMAEDTAGALDVHIRHRRWWGELCRLTIPPTSDTARVEALTTRTCTMQPPRRPVAALGGQGT